MINKKPYFKKEIENGKFLLKMFMYEKNLITGEEKYSSLREFKCDMPKSVEKEIFFLNEIHDRLSRFGSEKIHKYECSN